MSDRKEFKPYRLPDTGGSCVIAAEGIVLLALLSGRDKAVSFVVLCMNSEDVSPGFHALRNVGEEKYISSLVLTAFSAVDIDGCLVVNRSEMKADYSLHLLVCYFKCAAVPHGIHEITVGNAGETALGAERDVYLPGKRYIISKKPSCRTAVAAVDLKLPLAVEVFPCHALELGLGMLGSVNHSYFLSVIPESVRVIFLRFNYIFLRQKIQ